MQQGLFWGYLEKIVKYIFVSPDNKTTVMEMEHFFFFLLQKLLSTPVVHAGLHSSALFKGPFGVETVLCSVCTIIAMVQTSPPANHCAYLCPPPENGRY